MPARIDTSRPINENLGSEVVGTLQAPASIPPQADAEPVKLDDYKVQSSYSWIDHATNPSIVVPAPGIWKSKEEMPYTPSKDPSPHYIDESAHRCPASPLAAAIVAVKHEQPNFPFSNLDLVVDKTPFLHLLTWCSHPNEKEGKEFRIDLEMVGKKTVVMTRWEAKVVDMASKNIAHKFAEEMVQQLGSSDNFKITGHERIASFSFLGTEVLLRYPVAACTVAPPTSPKGANLALSPEQDLESGITIHATHTPLVAQSSIVDLITLSKTAKVDRSADIYDPLFITNVPTLLMARHAKGSIGTYEEVHLASMRTEKSKAQEGLKKVAVVLDQIKSFMSNVGANQQYSLVHKKGAATLELYQRQGGVSLPQGMKAYFE